MVQCLQELFVSVLFPLMSSTLTSAITSPLLRWSNVKHTRTLAWSKAIFINCYGITMGVAAVLYTPRPLFSFQLTTAGSEVAGRNKFHTSLVIESVLRKSEVCYLPRIQSEVTCPVLLRWMKGIISASIGSITH